MKLVHSISNLNCSELISLELGLINSSKTLIGLIPVYTDSLVTNTSLVLYFMKKTLHNSDGSNDLVTVVTLATVEVNKTLILSVLKKIMDKYFEFRLDLEAAAENSGGAPGEPPAKSKLGEFKLYMTQIIKFEKLQYDTNLRIYSYGALGGDDDASSSTSKLDVITPNQLLMANEEVDEVRLLMLDNISKLMNRGDKINSLVDQTDRLTSSSLVFQKRAQSIKRLMWLSNFKFVLMVSGIALVLFYFFIGFECGFPLFGKCIHH